MDVQTARRLRPVVGTLTAGESIDFGTRAGGSLSNYFLATRTAVQSVPDPGLRDDGGGLDRRGSWPPPPLAFPKSQPGGPKPGAGVLNCDSVAARHPVEASRNRPLIIPAPYQDMQINAGYGPRRGYAD